MTHKGTKRTIFMSYSASDEAYAEALRAEFKKLGFLLAGENAKTGGEIFSTLKRDLIKSDIVVFIVPPHEGSGRWALAELGAAKALDKNVVAILPDKMRYRNGDLLGGLFQSRVFDATGHSSRIVAQQVVESAMAEAAA
jgi:nucleoside 2-deoxyribosyltransferase